jgi:hypothetical protein
LTDIAKALRLRGGALAAHQGEGLLTADPGAGIDEFVGSFFHKREPPGSWRKRIAIR